MQIFEVQRWKQEDRSCGTFAFLASSGRSGILLLFEEQVAVDMRVVCPQDVERCF